MDSEEDRLCRMAVRAKRHTIELGVEGREVNRGSVFCDFIKVLFGVLLSGEKVAKRFDERDILLLIEGHFSRESLDDFPHKVRLGHFEGHSERKKSGLTLTG